MGKKSTHGVSSKDQSNCIIKAYLNFKTVTHQILSLEIKPYKKSGDLPVRCVKYQCTKSTLSG